MTFSNQNSAIAQVKDYQTKEALKKTEDQFKQLNDTITALTARVSTVETTQSLSSSSPTEVNGIWKKLHTFTASGSETEIKFEDSDGGFNSTYTTYMIIAESLAPSANTGVLNCQFSIGGNYKQYTSSSPVYYYDTGSANQYAIEMTEGQASGIRGNTSSVDFIGYLTAPRGSSVATRFRYSVNYETSGNNGAKLFTGCANFSGTSTTGTVNTATEIDGIRFTFYDGSSVTSITSGKVFFYGLV